MPPSLKCSTVCVIARYHTYAIVRPDAQLTSNMISPISFVFRRAGVLCIAPTLPVCGIASSSAFSARGINRSTGSYERVAYAGLNALTQNGSVSPKSTSSEREEGVLEQLGLGRLFGSVIGKVGALDIAISQASLCDLRNLMNILRSALLPLVIADRNLELNLQRANCDS